MSEERKIMKQLDVEVSTYTPANDQDWLTDLHLNSFTAALVPA